MGRLGLGKHWIGVFYESIILVAIQHFGSTSMLCKGDIMLCDDYEAVTLAMMGRI